jgi:para-aminobenzoate synthetase component 1
MFIDRALVFDHLARTVVLRHLSAAEGVEEWANDTRTRLLGLEPGEPDEPEPMTVSGARWRHDSTAYLALIGRCQDAIRMGDAYLLCLTNQITLDPIADVVDANRRLRRTNPSHHGGLLRFGAPAGSMTGAPKRSAMSIRTIVSTPDRATIGTGGGITALSVPEEELDEIHLKAEPLLRAIGAVTRRPRENETH